MLVGAERLAPLSRRMYGALAARMRELNTELRNAVAPAKVDHALQRGFILVAVKAQAAMADAPDSRDVRGFRDHQPGRAHGELAQVHQMPVVGGAVLRH